MSGPQIVCCNCGKPTSIYSPLCMKCMRAAGMELNDWTAGDELIAKAIEQHESTVPSVAIADPN